MDIFDKENICYDYFIQNKIKNRNELRDNYKTNPITGISQSFAENIFSIFKKENKKKENKTNSKVSTTVCISDMHIPNQDEKTCENVFNCIEEIQPQNLVLLGDIIDCYWDSKFIKNPKNTIFLQDEADTFYKIFSKLRRRIQNTNIYYILGNHEDRLFKNQCEHPQYMGLRALEPKELLKFDKLNIECLKNKLVLNNFIFYHGDKVRSNASYSAKAEFEGFQMNSGISGHTHRLGSYYHTCDNNTEVWFENGCLCSLNPEYIKPPKINWQQGFSVVSYYEGINQVEQILIQNNMFKYNGKIYK